MIANFGPTYNKFLSPPVSTENASSKLDIEVSTTIHSLANFDAVMGNYETKFTVQLKWFDSRLSFTNLREKPKVNGKSCSAVCRKSIHVLSIVIPIITGNRLS